MGVLELAYVRKGTFDLTYNNKKITSFDSYGSDISCSNVRTAVDALRAVKALSKSDEILVKYPEIITCECCGIHHDMAENMASGILSHKGEEVTYNNYCGTCVYLESKRFISMVEKGREYVNRFERRTRSSKPSKRKGLPSGIRLKVLQRDKSTCQMCGNKAPEVPIHVDHIIPVSKGGTNKLDNLQCLCAQCNISKSDKVALHIN